MTLRVCLAVLAAVLLFPQQKTSPPAGQVIDAVTKAPIAGARILLAAQDAHLSQSVVLETDDQGRVTPQRIPNGRFRWFAEAPGYLRKEIQPLTAGTVAALTPTAVIAGRVVTERGDPAPKVYVRAWVEKTLAGEAQTNDLGEFRIFDLPAGSYIVSAERYLAPSIDGTRYIVPTPPCPDCMGEGRGMTPLPGLMTQGAFIDSRVIGNRTYPVVYFPAATDRAAATSIGLTAGQQVSGIELRLTVK